MSAHRTAKWNLEVLAHDFPELKNLVLRCRCRDDVLFGVLERLVVLVVARARAVLREGDARVGWVDNDDAVRLHIGLRVGDAVEDGVVLLEAAARSRLNEDTAATSDVTPGLIGSGSFRIFKKDHFFFFCGVVFVSRSIIFDETKLF